MLYNDERLLTSMNAQIIEVFQHVAISKVSLLHFFCLEKTGQRSFSFYIKTYKAIRVLPTTKTTKVLFSISPGKLQLN